MQIDQQVLVVKIGGGNGVRVADICDDLAAVAGSRPLVVVHGVSAMMARLSRERNVPQEMLSSPSGHSFRYTNAQTRDLYVQAARLVNEQIVANLRERGINAIGVADEIAIRGDRKRAIRAVSNGRVRVIRDDYSGSITGVDAARLRALLDAGFVPVLPPIAMSDDGPLNIDGDRAGAAVASGLNADELVILSNVRGLYRQFPDEASLVSRISPQDLPSAVNWAQGRMKRKVLGAQEALADGVRRVVISDGRVASPVSQALRGAGTVFTC